MPLLWPRSLAKLFLLHRLPPFSIKKYRLKRPKLKRISPSGSVEMSRLDLTPEQIEVLDMETLEELRELLNEELCNLAEVERSIYKRRRVLQIEEDPSLLKDSFYQESVSKPRPQQSAKPTTQDIINAITKAGIDPGILKQFI